MIIMTLVKQGSSGSNEILRPSNVEEVNGKFICTEAPKMVDTKFGKKLFVSVKPAEGSFPDGQDIKTWIANRKSTNHLIDELGSEESDWVSCPIDLEVMPTVINNQKTNVIYAVGALEVTN
tara:strand:- start:77 stop:439 length:363 start_codon:yes stop_codon:yes gene_type:complete